MKCAYCSRDVSKEEAIKDGRYYHKECYRKRQGKREIEEYWLENINSGTVLQLLRKVIKDIVELYDVDYIIWALKRCREEGVNLQYPQGMKRMLDNSEYKKEWNKGKVNIEYNKLKSDVINNISSDVMFEYKPSKRKVSDII
jgi:hypothetical protein